MRQNRITYNNILCRVFQTASCSSEVDVNFSTKERIKCYSYFSVEELYKKRFRNRYYKNFTIIFGLLVYGTVWKHLRSTFSSITKRELATSTMNFTERFYCTFLENGHAHLTKRNLMDRNWNFSWTKKIAINRFSNRHVYCRNLWISEPS